MFLFGKGQREALPAITGRLGQRALVCTAERLAVRGNAALLLGSGAFAAFVERKWVTKRDQVFAGGHAAIR